MISETEQVLSELADLIGGVGRSSLANRGGARYFYLAANGTQSWTWPENRYVEAVVSDTAQASLTKNGLNYAQVTALTPVVDMSASQIIAYISTSSNIAQGLELHVFVAAGETLTLGCSSTAARIIVYWRLA